jgi:CheY-like chemotaxis protein
MRQVDYAKTIHGSGNDLLKLINDILDLAKIESGTVAIDLSDVLVADLELYVERTFRPVAESKNLSFTIELDPRTPVAIHTDLKRLQQILRNLLSNGFKFTDRGGVTLRVGVASEGWNPESELLNRAATVVAFSVTDTGIGIPPDKQHIIFEAFQQADGSTSRRYGGTGLGLAISREIARVLGGEIAVVSTPGVGSTFKLYLPQSTAAVARSVTRARVARELPPPEPPMAVELALPADDAVADDRLDIRPNDRVLVIVEDDPAFARVLLESAHARGFKGIVATRGAAGIALAQEYMPHAITLDVRLPDVSGWRLLSQLKGDLATRHIPIHIVSVQDDLDYGLVHGALGVASKPLSSEDVGGVIDRLADCVARPVKNLLLVEDDRLQREHLVELIGNGDVHTTAVGTGAEALQRSREERFDCVVVDLGLPDMDGIELIEQLRRESVRRDGPIVVYTARDLLAHDEERLQRLAQSIITKDPTAHERLFDATALYLHRAAVKMSESKRRMLERLHDRDALLAGKKILIVDDDIRNIYAMTSMLERHRMVVVPAENGREAIAALHGTPGIDGVLMDIMLPEMDGYETIRRIRGNAGFRNLPIIAVTAKAMRGDREKCIEAGASDYLAKPVDREQLLALLRLWLCR